MEKAKVNLTDRFKNWFVDMKVELKRVVWPSFARVRQNTMIVLLYVFLVGLVIWILDWIFTGGMGQIIK